MKERSNSKCEGKKQREGERERGGEQEQAEETQHVLGAGTETELLKLQVCARCEAL